MGLVPDKEDLKLKSTKNIIRQLVINSSINVHLKHIYKPSCIEYLIHLENQKLPQLHDVWYSEKPKLFITSQKSAEKHMLGDNH